MPIKNSITVIGLGYVGLPLLIELNKKFDVKGYDNDIQKIKYNQTYLSYSSRFVKIIVHHNGMLPCFFGGFSSRLFCKDANALTITCLVSIGEITAST